MGIKDGLLVKLGKLVESFQTVKLVVYIGVTITLTTVLVGVYHSINNCGDKKAPIFDIRPRFLSFCDPFFWV